MKTKPQIAMDDIPFAPLLSDTVPPVQPPPAPAPLKRPQTCRVVAWRHDGGLDNTTHCTIESATAFAKALHWAIYWKYALQCGRDMVDRQLIDAPVGHE